jgi:hypothetical protein
MPGGLGPDVIPGEPDPAEVARLKAAWDVERAARAAQVAAAEETSAAEAGGASVGMVVLGGTLESAGGTLVGLGAEKIITAAGGSQTTAQAGG